MRSGDRDRRLLFNPISSIEVVRPEGPGEQVAEREAPPEALGAAYEHRGGVGGELPDLLPASAAGGAQVVASAGHGDLRDAALAGHDHGGNRRRLGTDPLGISRVLDVAAAVDNATLGPHRRPDVESRVWRVRRLPSRDRRGDGSVGWRPHGAPVHGPGAVQFPGLAVPDERAATTGDRNSRTDVATGPNDEGTES